MINDYNARLNKIEEYISLILPDKINEMWIDLKILDTNFLTYIDNINRPVIDLIKRGGKRWRPMLMLLIYEMKNEPIEKIIPLTPLVELAHNGTLIIDDIEDNADMRRGFESIHKLYGIDMSINSANFVYFLVFSCISMGFFSNTAQFDFYKYYIKAMQFLHIGQGLDIQWHRRHDFIPSEADYYTMCKFKTGALSKLAAELAISASYDGFDKMGHLKNCDGKSEEIDTIGRACENMGLGFQILDDVINLSVGNPGKKRGDDIVEGKKSLPVILFKEAGGDVEKLAEYFNAAALNSGCEQEETVERAIALLESRNSINAAKEKALKILDDSKKIIENQYKKTTARDIIFFIFDTFVKPVI
jgi:octaprenyl-diphosphate synthase